MKEKYHCETHCHKIKITKNRSIWTRVHWHCCIITLIERMCLRMPGGIRF